MCVYLKGQGYEGSRSVAGSDGGGREGPRGWTEDEEGRARQNNMNFS